MKNRLDGVRDFFSSYFHEDWQCEANTPRQAIENYIKTAPADEVLDIVNGILLYVSMEPEDTTLEAKLFSDLGCYYSPSSDNVTAREWLRTVAAIMAAYINAK